MASSRLSRLAVASVVFGLPPVAASLWCAWRVRAASGEVAGEVALVPGLCSVAFFAPGVACGLRALEVIREGGGRLCGRWLAVAGLALAALPPALYVAAIARAAAGHAEPGAAADTRRRTGP